jgi:hypothetical protein
MSLYETSVPKLTAKERKELFLNIIKAAAGFRLSTEVFESVAKSHGVSYPSTKADTSLETFGIPRLKLFPLTNKAQVLSAISRFPFIKAEISDREREYLVINILRAATEFNIDASAFRDRVRKS